eukprot:scaffold74933_cov54-Phaeocystis_antarctica.AAC.2
MCSRPALLLSSTSWALRRCERRQSNPNTAIRWTTQRLGLLHGVKTGKEPPLGKNRLVGGVG